LNRKTDPRTLHKPLIETFDEFRSILNWHEDHKYLVERIRYNSDVYKEAFKIALEAPYREFINYLTSLISKRMRYEHFDLFEMK